MSPSEREKYTSMFWDLASEYEMYTSVFWVLSKEIKYNVPAPYEGNQVQVNLSYYKRVQVSPSEPKLVLASMKYTHECSKSLARKQVQVTLN